ncbi:MAG TPA: hypothetical protein VH268_12495 [Solirubrobacterales bacterium]|jgi:hypothetical protein|nr:hypothetical protein [Solirubrobacterales bacterium]
MSPQTAPEFGPPLIGQTEKALDAILLRQLEGSELSASGWVLLRLVAVVGGRIGRQDLIERAAAASKFAPQDTEVEIGRLVWAELLTREGDELVVTAGARELQDRVQAAVAEITARLWGGLPATDLATAGKVLGTVLSRANAELGYSI